jgi:hypothetical protein
MGISFRKILDSLFGTREMRVRREKEEEEVDRWKSKRQRR